MTPVELADTPMTPGEPEGHDNLYPDCLPSPPAGDQAASTSPSGSAFAPSPLLPFLYQRSTPGLRPSPVLWVVCRSPRHSAELKEMILCILQVPALGPPSSLLEAPWLGVDSVPSLGMQRASPDHSSDAEITISETSREVHSSLQVTGGLGVLCRGPKCQAPVEQPRESDARLSDRRWPLFRDRSSPPAGAGKCRGPGDRRGQAGTGRDRQGQAGAGLRSTQQRSLSWAAPPRSQTRHGAAISHRACLSFHSHGPFTGRFL